MNRREFIGALGSAGAWAIPARAQQREPAPKRVGILSHFGCPMPPGFALPSRLAELSGWIGARTVVFECVSAVGRLDQPPALARELVSRRPDVLTATPISFVNALKRETTTIPIVMLLTPEPVRTGLVTNLARPEGNITGVAWFGFDILSKRIEFLKETVPNLRRLAIISSVYGDLEADDIIEENLNIAASKLGFAWHRFRAVAANDYDEIFGRLAAEHFDAAYIAWDGFTNLYILRIIDLALRYLIPAVGEASGWARIGLLFNYGQDFYGGMRRGAEYVDKILRGAKPSELPVEQATTLELGINLKTAKVLGLTVPPSLIARADEVIE